MSAFDDRALTAVRSLGAVQGEASSFFLGCNSLTTIPAGLFDHFTAATNFDMCFAGCTSLTGETPYTMVDGKKVRLWDRSPENGFTKVTSYNACFAVCNGLSDFAEIPEGWK